jgi:hypothetical protein
MQDKILTKHPEGKKGVNISKAKYALVRAAVEGSLRKKPLSHDELVAAVRQRLDGTFDGSIPWYAEGVKLDLEARGAITRTDEKPQRYRLTGT